MESKTGLLVAHQQHSPGASQNLFYIKRRKVGEEVLSTNSSIVFELVPGYPMEEM